MPAGNNQRSAEDWCAAWANVRQVATADPDGDGVTNLEEFLAGTNPVDLLSALRLAADRADGGACVGTDVVRAERVRLHG